MCNIVLNHGPRILVTYAKTASAIDRNIYQHVRENEKALKQVITFKTNRKARTKMKHLNNYTVCSPE